MESSTHSISTTHVQVKKLLSRSFAWMALGLLISTAITFAVIIVPFLASLLFSSGVVFIILLLVELGLVWYLSARYEKMSVTAARASFIMYATLNGFTLSVIFFSYSLSSIISIFVGAMAMFAALSLYGAITKQSLAKAGQIAFFALIGLIIASIVNVFVGGSILEMIIAWVGVIIFAVITPARVQQIKITGEHVHSPEDLNRLSIVSALGLYLTFINLFLSILRIFGRRR